MHTGPTWNFWTSCSSASNTVISETEKIEVAKSAHERLDFFLCQRATQLFYQSYRFTQMFHGSPWENKASIRHKRIQT